MPESILDKVRVAASQRILFLPHAIQQMSRPDRMITPAEVEAVALHGEVIEDYPDDARGHSCLLLGRGDTNRWIHVHCTPKENYLAIITAYVPDPSLWSENVRRRI